MLGLFAEKFRILGILFIPCLLFGCLPPVEDTWMMTWFVLSQVIYYTLQNVSGMLLLATLVLILWTKNILMRWYTKQVLTREFFVKLLYMGLTGILSMLAVAFVWVPLYDAFACAMNKLDVTTGNFVMRWRDHIFAVTAFAMAASTVASSDIVLSPSRVDETGIPWLLQKAVGRLTRVAQACARVATGASRYTCRTMRIVNTQLSRLTTTLPIFKTLPHLRRHLLAGDGARTRTGAVSRTQPRTATNRFLRTRSRRIANLALRRMAASSQSSEMILHEPLPHAETSPSSDSVIFSTSAMLQRSVCPRFSRAAASAARLSASRWSSNSCTSQATQSCVSADSGTSVDEASNSSATDRAGPATRARPGLQRRGRKTVVLDPAVSSPMTRSRTRMLGLETRLGSGGHRRSARDRKQR